MKRLALRPRRGRDGEVIQEFAIVDDDDYDGLTEYVWYYKVDNAGDSKRRRYSVARAPVGSADTHRKQSLVLLGRHVLGIDDPSINVIHVNGNPLDCRKRNLRVALNGYDVLRLREHWLSQLQIGFKLRR